MTGSASAECLMYIDDFTVTPDQLGTEIDLCIKAEFSARVSAWQLDFTFPEGLTPVDAELGEDGYLTYLNSRGRTMTYTPSFIITNDNSRLIATSSQVGYWYDSDEGGYTSYGVVKWEGGSYEEMVILHVEVSEDFQGGEIIMYTECVSGSDTRGGTVRENGDHGVTYTHVCNVGVSGSSEPEAYACYTPSNTTLTFYYDNQRASRAGSTYDLNTGYSSPLWYSDCTYSSVTRAVFDSSFGDTRPTTTYRWFSGMSHLEAITGMQYLNTSNVTNMEYLFYGCTRLTSLDLSNFNPANVTDMAYMFYDCTGLTSLDLSNFNTANVTTMSYMLFNCTGLTSLDLSSFNTEKVTSMYYMFRYCTRLTTLDLSSFNTSNVIYMNSMFENCPGLMTLDLSSFNTAKVTGMSYMFNHCTSLTTIYVGNGWSTATVTSSTDMFNQCTSLVGSQGTTYSSSHVDKAYAHIDGGPSNPGYFTEGPAVTPGDVNGDGEVAISDVTALIHYLLTGDTTGVDVNGADCNQDGEVSIADVTTLIHYLLTGYW